MTILQKIQSLLTAANAKTGESDSTLTDAVQTLIDGYGQGGGGSLPSSISKIDGGSFTLARDTAGTRHWISHSLGVAPKGVFVWTEDTDLRTSTAALAERYLLCSTIAILEWVTSTTTNAAFPVHLFRGTSGSASSTGSPISQADLGNYFQTTRFTNAVVSVYYKAGAEYKWLAWA